jgi:hypothetical protein
LLYYNIPAYNDPHAIDKMQDITIFAPSSAALMPIIDALAPSCLPLNGTPIELPEPPTIISTPYATPVSTSAATTATSQPATTTPSTATTSIPSLSIAPTPIVIHIVPVTTNVTSTTTVAPITASHTTTVHTTKAATTTAVTATATVVPSTVNATTAPPTTIPSLVNLPNITTPGRNEFTGDLVTQPYIFLYDPQESAFTDSKSLANQAASKSTSRYHDKYGLHKESRWDKALLAKLYSIPHNVLQSLVNSHIAHPATSSPIFSNYTVENASLVDLNGYPINVVETNTSGNYTIDGTNATIIYHDIVNANGFIHVLNYIINYTAPSQASPQPIPGAMAVNGTQCPPGIAPQAVVSNGTSSQWPLPGCVTPSATTSAAPTSASSYVPNITLPTTTPPTTSIPSPGFVNVTRGKCGAGEAVCFVIDPYR